MARIRTIKPEFFRHEGLQDLAAVHGAHVMLVFAGLWGHCDRAGRFECRPRHLKLDILPFLDFDMADTLALLEGAGFLQTYEVGGKRYGVIDSFGDHQRFGGKEASEPAKYPAPPENREGSNGEATGKQSVPLEGERNKGREGKGVEAREQVRASPPEPPPADKPKPEKNNRGLRWPPDAVVPDDWLESGELARLESQLPAIDLRAEATKFANYWASKSGGSATKVDWKRTWINWALNAHGGQNGQRNRGKSQLEQIADIARQGLAATVVND